MSTYTTPAQDAARIRADLKKFHGITNRQVSVKARSFSMGSAIDVRVHDHTIDIREVKNIAAKSEHVRRCESTGEILCGGNQHLTVTYSDAACQAYTAAHAVEIAAVIAGRETPERRGALAAQVDGLAVCLLADGIGTWRISIGKEWGTRVWEPTAETIARAILGMRTR